jgi:hypothetical protein
MKIYRVVMDVDGCQSLLPKDESVYETKLLMLDGTKKSDIWPSKLEAVLDNENRAVPDVYSFGAGNFLLTARARNVLDRGLSTAEFLPVFWSQGSGWLVNIVGCYDCLNNERIKWCIDEGSGKKLFVEEYSFLPEKIDCSSFVFKIKEECFELFCADFESGSDSLLSIVASNKLKGFVFELVWEG